MSETSKAGGKKPAASRKKATAKAATKKTAARQSGAKKAAAQATAAKKTTASKAVPRKARRGNGLAPEERWRRIAEAAYLRAEQRGFQGGDPVADWLAAEAEVDAAPRA